MYTRLIKMKENDKKEDAGKEYLNLTQNQRDVLRGEENATKPGAFLQDILTKKVERLPKRLNSLLLDIEVLNEASFFQSDWEGEVWDSVRTSDDKWQSYEWEPILREILSDDSVDVDYAPKSAREFLRRLKEADKFGKNLGLAIHRLTRNNMPKDMLKKLASGFLRGLLLGETDYYDRRTGEARIKVIFNHLENEKVRWLDELQLPDADEVHPYHNDVPDNVLKSVIKQAGLTYSETLSEYLTDEAFHVPPPGDPTIPDAGPNNEKPVEYPDIPAIEGKRRRCQHTIEPIKKNTEIASAEQLINKLQELRRLLSNNRRHFELFKNIYKNSSLPESYNLFLNEYEFFDEGYDEKMKLMYSLAGEKGTFEEFPLVTQRVGDGSWKLTPIGELIGYISLEKDNDALICELPHKHVLGVEMSERETQMIKTTMKFMHSPHSSSF